jgi:nitroimidazol reductase NimA-like FMN-containing flavoprotein (pyridoxamine 5'-phosphate oxidase superfamily)
MMMIVMGADELGARFDEIVGASHYMTIATADGEGAPWASPVWFACVDGREFLWVSSPDARHSRNIAERPEVAIAIFDSRQAPGTGAGVYVAAAAAQVPDEELDAAVAVFSRISEAAEGSSWGRTDVEAPAKHRLYRAVARERFVLSARDERIPVPC